MDPIDVVKEIDGYVNSFANDIGPIQRKLYDRVSAILKDLSIDGDGNIKRTTQNLKLINQVKDELNQVISDPRYQKNIAQLKGALQDVNELQTDYFSDINPIVTTAPAVVNTIQSEAFKDTITTLTGAGLKENVVNAAADIVNTGVTEGTSFTEMNEKLKDFMIGDKEVDGKLLSYTKQIVSDTMHTASRNYNSIMTNKLGLKWYRYVGAEVQTTRPWCRAMVSKQWIHESELGTLCRGDVDGRKVSLQGLMPDTTKENVISRCGGYNCGHHLVPVPADSVPTKIRRKFETSNINPDSEEVAEARPRHK